VARTYLRFLAAIAIAVAIELLPSWLHVHGLFLGQSNLAIAQGNYPTDPITGAPQGISSNGVGTTGGVGVGPNPFQPGGNGPNGPTRPTNPTRPASWPGGPEDPANPNPPPLGGNLAGGANSPSVTAPSGATSPATAQSVQRKRSPADPAKIDPAEIVAYVGSEFVQANELLPVVNERLAMFLAKPPAGFDQLPPAAREEQINQGRRLLMKQQLEDTIRIKLLLAEIRRKISSEQWTKHEEQMRKYFNTNDIKPLQEQYKATSVMDLDNKLRKQGSSLDAQRTASIERNMAISWLNTEVKDEKREATHEEMLTYYRAHLSDWETPARVRWEQLTVKFQNYDSKAAARSALVRWGNEIWRGAPFAAVAKAHSQDIAAEDGGLHPWVGKGSLRSSVLDEALFALPVGALSQILEDDDGLHIVRVLEREDAKRTGFSEVQPEIKKTLQSGNKDQQRMEYIAKLRKKTRVLTIFDDDFTARTSPSTAPATR
jgi:hypothetical protein